MVILSFSDLCLLLNHFRLHQKIMMLAQFWLELQDRKDSSLEVVSTLLSQVNLLFQFVTFSLLFLLYFLASIVHFL